MGASGSVGRVQEQVERILDEEPTARISVIVRMAEPDEETRELVAAAAGGVRVRPLALSPRELLPATTRQVERTAGRPRGAKVHSPEVAGLAAQVPSPGPPRQPCATRAGPPCGRCWSSTRSARPLAGTVRGGRSRPRRCRWPGRRCCTCAATTWPPCPRPSPRSATSSPTVSCGCRRWWRYTASRSRWRTTRRAPGACWRSTRSPAGGDASGQWIGVAPETRIAAGLVLNGGSGTDAQVLAGINWAVTTGPTSSACRWAA